MEQLEVIPIYAKLFYKFVTLLGLHISMRDAIALGYFLLVCVIVVGLTVVYRNKYTIVPNWFQQLLEGYYSFIRNLCVEMIGPHHGEQFVSFIGTLGLLIWFSNLIGLIPGFISPTSNLNVTAGASVFVFLYYHYVGIKQHGVKYFKHFMGPTIFLAWLFIPMEIISHFARPLSLSLRLFGNIFGEDLAILIIFVVVFPIFLPLPFMILAIITSTVQALVFIMLSMVYISGAVEEAH